MVEEFNERIASARLDSAYQIGPKKLKMRFHSTGKGSFDLIITPDYACITKYQRKAPEKPTPFAMQLRKRLEGAILKHVEQHGFDRILEFSLQGHEGCFNLIAELFSSGNVVLCDSNQKIIGLLEWQSWKDRTLGVGQTYQYPPANPNPLLMDKKALKAVLDSSGKNLASTLATEASLGGLYAEEVCLLAGVKKDSVSNDLSNADSNKVLEVFESMTGRIKKLEKRPAIISKAGTNIDVVPFDLESYRGFEVRFYESFNDAVDEFFSREEFREKKAEAELKLDEELKRLREMEAKQKGVIERFEKEAVELKETGDLIYQHFSLLETLAAAIKQERDGGATWDELRAKYRCKEYDGLFVEEITKEGQLILKATK